MNETTFHSLWIIRIIIMVQQAVLRDTLVKIQLFGRFTTVAWKRALFIAPFNFGKYHLLHALNLFKDTLEHPSTSLCLIPQPGCRFLAYSHTIRTSIHCMDDIFWCLEAPSQSRLQLIPTSTYFLEYPLWYHSLDAVSWPRPNNIHWADNDTFRLQFLTFASISAPFTTTTHPIDNIPSH